jgi:hypothetical protein
VVVGDGSAEELDEAELVATVDNSKALLELGPTASQSPSQAPRARLSTALSSDPSSLQDPSS